jgi:molybdopterin molybdotransferase
MGFNMVEERGTIMSSGVNDDKGLSFQSALETILRYINILNTRELSLQRSPGYVLAEDIYSGYDLPAEDISGSDGYALRSDDIKNANQTSPVILRIVETARAGRLPRKTVKPGTAIRIMTGSVVPEGADSIVRFEDTDEPENKNGPNPQNPMEVKIFIQGSPGDNIRRKGYQVRNGSLVLRKGMSIGPAQISALSAIGMLTVKVIRKPVVAVITTGDELIKIGKSLPPGKVYNSNAPALEALLIHYGCIPRYLGIARDNINSLLRKIQNGLEFDAIITTGGVSWGDYDLVRSGLEQVGKIIFSRVKMSPGASFSFGLVNNPSQDGENNSIPVFALSGPPNGSVINFETLVRPALLKMRGITRLDHPAVEATSRDSITGKKSMTTIKWTDLNKIDGGYQVKLNNVDGSLVSMANANSLMLIPPGCSINAGQRVSVWSLDWSQ